MYTDGQIYMGLADGRRVNMQLNMSNRHGLIAGASGTGHRQDHHYESYGGIIFGRGSSGIFM